MATASGSGEFEPLTTAPQGDQSAGQPISLVGQLAAEWSVWSVLRPLVSRLLKAVAPFGAMGITIAKGKKAAFFLGVQGMQQVWV